MFSIALQLVILAAALLNAFLGLVVLKRNTKSVANVTFFVLALVTSAWVFLNFLLISYPNLYLLKAAYSTGALGASAYLGWALIFCYKRIKIAFFPYLTGAIVFVMSFSPFVVKRLAHFSITGSSVEYGFLFPIWCLYVGIVAVSAVGVLFISLRQESGIKKNQIRYVFLGAALFASAMVIISLILPLLKVNVLFMLDSPSSLFFIAFSAYAMIKHRFMDIRALVLKSVAYSVVLGIIAGLYAAGSYLLVQRYQGIVNQNVFNIVVIFVAILGFNPLRRFVEKYTDRIFAKGRYSFNELLGKLGKVVSSTVVLDELAENTLETLIKDMRLARAAFVETGSTTVKEVKTIGYKRYAKSTWEKAVKLAASKDELVVADELGEDSKEKQLLRRLSTEVLLPLTTEDNLVGVLALGEKRSGDMFTAEDLRLLEIIAPETAVAVQNAETFKEREARIRELGALSNLALSLGATLELDEILDLLLEQAITVIGAENGSIMMLDETGKTLSMRASRGLPEELLGTRVKLGEGIAGYVAKTKEPTIIIDGGHENEYLEQCLAREDITSSLTVPLKAQEKVIGVLSVNRKRKKEVFTQENLRLIASFAAHAAEAIQNARLYDHLEGTFLGTITALAAAVDARDHYTAGHSEAVTKYGVTIAKKLGMSSGEVKDVEIACKLHDVGKIGIDDAILNKPGRLTDEERKHIEQHPKIAVDILKSVDLLKDVIPLILYHHERMDGKGYPTGLAGQAIPLGARIITVIDSYNAMTSDRPYRKALPQKVAVEELERCSGTQFDPEVADVFLSILEEEKQARKKAKLDNRNSKKPNHSKKPKTS